MIASCAVGLGCEAPAHAQTAQADHFDYSVGVELEHDSDVNLSGSDPVSQNVLTTNLVFDYAERGSTLEAVAAGNIQYRDYLGGAYSDELRGMLSGVFDWHILPNYLDWSLEDYAGRQPVDVLANDTPDNQQETNVLVTGPTLRARFSDQFRGQLDLRYTNSHAEKMRDFNGDRYGATARLVDLATPTDTLIGNLGVESVRYDNVSDANDYDRADAYGTYVRNGPHSRLEANLGYTRLDFKGGAQSHDDVFLRGSGRYDFADRTSATLAFAHQFSDTLSLLQVDPARVGMVVVGSGLDNALVTPGIFAENRVSFGIEHRGDVYALNFAPFWYRDRYLNNDVPSALTGLDVRAHGFYAAYDYRLQRELTLTAFAGTEYHRYTDLDRHDRDYDFGLRLGWQMAAHWSSRCSVSRDIRATSAADLSYHGNTILVGATYSR